MADKPLTLARLACLILTFGFLPWAAPLCYASGDFNGDGRDDIITFVRDSYADPGQADVYVALSGGAGFGAGQRWHESFGYGLEIPGVGDFNGDGKDDIIVFVRDTQVDPHRGRVWVSLSSGSSFVGSYVWNNFFCIGNEIPGVGDFNGDGKDDIIIFVRNAKGGAGRGDVYVALSNGSSFVGAGTWHDFFCINNEIPAVGDVDGDGRDDIISFNRGAGDVYVALSTGSSFSGTGAKWHDFFCINDEIPVVGDFDGNGRDDIASFARSGAVRGNIYVALSTGSSFSGTGQIWKDWSGAVNYIPDTGDFNGDGKDDFACFLHMVHTGSYYDARTGDVEVALSNGSQFGTTKVWHGYFSVMDEVPTMLSAVFPYYMFSRTFENTSARCGGYVSNEEDRFTGYVSEFKQEFQDSWPFSQYYWAHPFQFAQEHLHRVDAVDMAFVGCHGGPARITLCDGERAWLTNCAWGSWSSNSRRGDLEYIAFESCKVTRLTGTWWENWVSSPNTKGPFSGLHVACGFHNNHNYTPAFSLGDEFAENLEDNFTVRWAWMEATDDEDDWVTWHTNIGSVIYLLPHKYERAGGYLTYDRWYHDSDYIMEAQYWDY